jgi:hypothetical protein
MQKKTIGKILKTIQNICWMIIIFILGFGMASSHNEGKIKELQNEAISRGYAQLIIVDRDKTEFQWIDQKISNKN